MIIYQTYRNSDMTEGKGPMVPSKAFLHKKDAEDFIDELELAKHVYSKLTDKQITAFIKYYEEIKI